MINEERVRELYKLAAYDGHRKKIDEQSGEYYMWDYVGKELVKSFVSGSLAYMLLVVLWVMKDVERITAMLQGDGIVNLGMQVGILYIGFLAVYLFVTVAIYSSRYIAGRKRLRKYTGRMKKVDKMYHREEKLKM